jgi:predicted nuclease with TOPRIM domain
VQALTLTRSRAIRRAVEVAQTARVMEHERANAELRADLKQAQLKIAEVEERQCSLRSGYTKLESECDGLHNAAEALKLEKAVAEKDRNAIHHRFQDYHVHHHKKISDLRFNLEKAYPGKNMTISNIIGWFDDEIKVLPVTITKANKIFDCHTIVGVL